MNDIPTQIDYFDGNTKKLIRSMPWKDVPESLRYGEKKDGTQVAIAKVYIFESPTGAEIHEMSVEGEVVRRTYQRKV